MRTVALPAGERVPAYGQGTWRMGEDTAKRAQEIATLRLGLDLGATLIDTAEMYGEGKAEELIGEAIAGRRDVQTDQVLYNLMRRGIERDLLPRLRERRVPVMAYSPVEQARLLRDPKLVAFAKRHGMNPPHAAG